MSKVIKPSSVLFEQIALQFAAIYFEAAMSTGFKNVDKHGRKKYKDARHFARLNVEKFVLKAVEYCMDMLNRPDIAKEMKDTIFEALQDRINDPSNKFVEDSLPEIDPRFWKATKPPDPIVINTKKVDDDTTKTVLHK